MIRKTILSILLAVPAWISPVMAIGETCGPEKLVNGSFDRPGPGNGTPYLGWTGRSGQGGTYTFELVEGKTGKAAKISGTRAGRAHLFCDGGFQAKAGEVLRIRFLTKTTNLQGGVFANLEGEPDNDGWHRINIASSPDWQQCETRVTVPRGAQGQEEPRIGLWFYHFGTGDLYLDEISVCTVTPDEPAIARRELAAIQAWGKAFDQEDGVTRRIQELASAAGRSPSLPEVETVRRQALEIIGRHQGSGGGFAVGIASGLDRVFLDQPYRGRFGHSMEITLARNESEAGQLAVISAGRELKGVTVSLGEDLSGPGGARLAAEQVRIDRIGFVDTTEGQRPYQSPRPGWWPDPLLPNAAFDVGASEVQPLLVTVTTRAGTAPGRYTGNLTVRAAGQQVLLPLTVRVYSFALPAKSRLATLVLGGEEKTVSRFYGEDPDGKTAERFAEAAARRRLPPGGLLNGWGWKTPKVPGQDGRYDFSKLDRWIELLKPYITRFPAVVVPRFRKFGGGEYDESFKRSMEDFLKAYLRHLQAKGLHEAAVFYNLDEASNDQKLREWEVCREMYALSKKAVPDLPVMQCLNEFKGVQALAGHADIWDLYFGQYEQAGGPDRLRAGDGITLSVCVWPSGHPNLFVEYPLLDARILPWICHREGATGFEYWDLYQTWDANTGNPDWWQSARTTWKLVANHGDGLLLYPGPAGTPLSSLRLESLRDGLEDYDCLVLLEERDHAGAAALLQEARSTLIQGVTSYATDPDQLLDLRRRIGECLSREP